MTQTQTTPAVKLYTTLPLNPSTGYQPCRAETGWYGQHPVTGPHTWAVDSKHTDGTVNRMHGAWDQEGATRFAWSMCNGDRSKAVEVEPYYYCAAWGRVPTESVHELDDANVRSWKIRPAAALVLGSEVRDA